jgi:suppressor of ftsI
MFLLAGGLPAAGQDAGAMRMDSCHGTELSSPDPLFPSRDLYCMVLVPVPGLEVSRAEVELGWPQTPFGVAVSPDGAQRYDLTFHLEGLPEPATLGPYTTYVAWLTTPLLHPEVSLGAVGNGDTPAGVIDWDRFLIFVTAEPSADVTERTGRLVLRGQSPSTRMQPADIHEFLAGTLGVTPADLEAGEHTGPPAPAGGHEHHGHQGGGDGDPWGHPPMPRGLEELVMLPAEMALRPQAAPDLPADAPDAPAARPAPSLDLAPGDTVHLTAAPVRWTVAGRTFTALGINGSIPAPRLRIPEGATVHVVVHNAMDRPTAIHWHGLRLENPFDGAPPHTQDPIPPGESFHYRLHTPDPGTFWYHAHVQEDLQQELGLYGNLEVIPARPDLFGAAHRDLFLLLDDLLLGEEGAIPFGDGTPTHALMGRFGNVPVVNGREGGSRTPLAEARPGEVLRLHLTNTSNTRTLNLSLPGARMKLVGTDLGAYTREEWVESVALAPAERYVVLVRPDTPGDLPLVNAVRAIDHLFGVFIPRVDTLGVIRVQGEPQPLDGVVEAFDALRENPSVLGELAPVLAHRDRAPDRTLLLDVAVQDLPLVTERLMQFDSLYFHPVEWEGTMPAMNMAATGDQVRWILRDAATGAENEAIHWGFRVGDVVKVRISNLRESIHGMQHPMHFHGQRFVVTHRNGRPVENPAWKDTVLVPVGTTVDILLELSNPGTWMIHCHIAEHLEAGMMAHFEVTGEDILRR